MCGIVPNFGDMNIDIKSLSGQTLLSTPINTGAKGYFSLMQHDYITLPFTLSEPIDFGLGSYVDLRGVFPDALGGKLAKIYYVTDLQNPTYNTSTGGYEYELRLDAYYWLWKNKIFKYTPENAGQEASWSLTAALDVHLGVFLRNLTALGYTYGGGEYEFSIDSTVENKAVALTYDNTSLIDALNRMAEAWDCEWWVTENVIHFGRLENGDAVELEIGVQAEDMTRNESKGTYATRIYAFGSTKNIPENYRPNDNEDLTVNGVVQKRLMLPDGTPYIDARPGLTEQEVVESVVVFDDIYPRRVGTLSDVKTVDRAIEDEEGNQTGTFKAYQYKDTGLTFSPDYVLEGQELRIVFQSGKMNGLDFGVTFNPDNADPAEQLWEIVANEDYGRRLPDEVIKPENGDTYILYGFDIKLVSDQYIPAAEQELKAKAEEYVAKTQVDDGTYTVPLYSSWVEADEVNRTFDAGQRVKLKNPAFFGTSGRTSRVIGWEMCLDIPYDRPVYTIGESAQYSRLGELEDKVDSLTLNGQAYQGIGGGSGVYLIRTNDSTPASNSNAYSALRARQEFISKTKEDTAKGKITFVKGIDIGSFSQNAGGGTFRVLEDLTTYAEVDRLRVRVKAYFETLEIINTNSVGGKMILTAGGGVYLREVKDRETLEDGTEQVWDFYRCYFLTEQDGREVENRFHVGDLAMSQSFNIKGGTHQGVTNHYYWREVVGIGDDYIDLSKTICDTGSDAPMAEDTVCHLGNRSDKDRQGAIIFSAVDVFSPSITLYYGINDFSLVGKDYVAYGVDKTTGNAFFRVYGEMYAGDREQTSYVKYTPGVGVEMRGKFLNQAGESYDTIIDSIQNAIDGNIETWFGEEEPTLSNEPAVNWTTDEDKNTHLGDLYYSDAGVAYRFQMEGANYVWKMLKDSDITKALADAKAAKDAADAAQEAADAAADRLTAWASDGVISPTEKQGIKDEIARIDADKANITAQYTKYGLGTPTAFNNAYTAYRAVLVSLSAATPENIAIPSDFSSKQTYYYNERTSALGAIADASITSVNNVTEQLEQMQQDFAEVKEDVAGVKTSVDGLKNFTDEAFADGIVDRNESAAIASHINSIETFAKDAAESYTKVYDNTLLTGTAKTNLANAYTAFTTAKTELVTTINGVIADGLVDALEKSAVDGKYTAFNTKYGDFVANLNAANRAIQDAINQNALQALQKIGELDYLKAALKEFTTIEGGLIQSSTLALGYTSDSGYQVMAGTNGIYDASKLGGGIASWWGGAMFDRFEYTEETMPENVASALVRMDGTGYFAKGNLWWESDGTLHADPLSFFVGEDSVGDVLGLFQFVKSDAGIEYVIPQYPFQKLEIGNYLQIGKAQLYWDEANQAFYVRHQDGVSPVGFYATGFISAKGANPDAGGTVSGASSLDGLSDVDLSNIQDGQVLAYDTATQKWVNKSVSAGGLDEEALAEYLTDNQYAKKSDISIAGLTDLHSSWDALLKAQKPTTLAGYGIADGVNAVSVTGSGNVVTSASVSGHVLTLTKGVNALTSVSLATISDLHSSWDAVLKAQKPAWLTTVSLATISDLHASWDALLKAQKPTNLAGYGITDGVNAVSVTGSGNAVTAASVSGHTLTLTKGSSFLLSSSYTAADILAKLKTVDGSGSGLDADTLDGYHLSNIETGGWTTFTTYVYDETNDTRYYCYRIGNLNNTGDVILRVRVIDDINYPSYSEWTLRMAFSSNYTPVVSLVPNTPCDRTLTVYVDSSKYLWMKCNATWDSSMQYKIERQTGSILITSNPSKVETTPANVSYTITNFGSTRNGVANKSYSHWANTYVAKTSIQIGSGTITWDSATGAFHFSHGVYSDSWISAKGANSGSGGTVSGVTKLSDLSDVQLGTLATNQVLSWNGSKWVNKAISTGLDETALAQYLTNNQYLTMPTGDARYVKKAGDTMTGLLTLKTEAHHTGLKLSNTYLTAISGNVIFQNNNSLRFGSDNWDYNTWAGLKYNHSSKYIYLGIADGSIFQANAAQSGGSILTPGISNIFVGNNTTNKVWHAGNDGSGSGLDADLLDGYHRSNLYGSVDTWLSVVGLTKTITVTGDKNTYYPVEITVSSSKRIPTIISIHKDLGSTTPDISGNHSNGTSSLWLIYEMRKTSWDGNGGFVRTVYKSQPYATLVANAKNNTSNGGNLIVWLRGGTCSYQVTCTNTFTATPYYTTTNVSHQTGYTDNVSPTTSISNGGIFGGIQWYGNVTGNVTGNAATATTATQANQLTTARTINGTAFNGTSNIVTSYWGTARNFYIRDHDSSHTGAAVSVNGSVNEYLLLPSTITATLNGNATSASYWQTARTLTVSGDATGSVSIRGNANMSLSLDVKYATSAGNADTVDSLHASAFARKDQNPAVDLNTVNGIGIMSNPANANATTARHYPIQEAGTLFYGAAAYSSANQIYGTFSSNRWFFRGGGGSTTTKTAWKEMAFLTSNVASATKLQTARTIWGQSFNGTANVSGNMTGVGSISASGAFATSSKAILQFTSYTHKNLLTWGWTSAKSDYIRFDIPGTNGQGIWMELRAGSPYGLYLNGTFQASSGIYSNGYVSALGQNSSDARLKTNIRDFNATTLIKQLHPKSFEWNDLAKSKFEVFRNTGTQYGLIAQDVKEVMPEWVDDNLIGSGYMGIRYDKLIPVLLQGEIETISRVETLEDKVRRLEKENGKLKKRIKELERRAA